MANVRQVRLGDNSVYLLEGADERVLVDTGPDYQGARETLGSAIDGATPDMVLATHGHLDHAGLGKWWQDDRHVPVAIGAGDGHLARAPQLSDPAEFEAFTGWVQASGAPDEVRAEVIHGLEQRRAWAVAAGKAGGYPPMGREHRWPSGLKYEHFEPRRLIVGDTTLPAGLRALVLPGHTPGNIVAVHEGEGWLFSGDQLLPEITPIPAVQAKAPGSGGDWRFRSLPAFVDALNRLHSMRFSRCFPGHGEPFDAVSDTIAANLGQIEQRTAKVAETLAGLGRASVYRLSEELYPRAVRRRFWQIVATVQGHLDLLEDRRLARPTGGAYEFSKT